MPVCHGGSVGLFAEEEEEENGEVVNVFFTSCSHAVVFALFSRAASQFDQPSTPS